MSSISVYNQEGKEVSKIKLNEAIFSLPWNNDLVHQAVKVAFSNKRQILASTKDRSEVRGGGRKPWRQKGTGRARHGSTRSPIWRHGGITFGPTTERNFKLKINKKMAKKALLTVFSAKAKDNEILILEDLKLTAPKTKEMAKVMANFPQVKSGLFIMFGLNENVKRAANNLPNFQIVNINNLDILSILKYQYLIFTKLGIEYLEKKYGIAK